MAASGFTIDGELRLNIVEDALIVDQAHPLGTYDRGSHEIHLMSFDRFCTACSEHPLFGQTAVRELYRSVIAHEVAHAIADRNFQIEKPSHTAHEYIAYVVQLAVMQPKLRQAILDERGLPPFADSSEITWIYFAIDPEAFGIKSYLHYRNPKNGNEFLRKLLTGQIRLSDDERLY